MTKETFPDHSIEGNTDVPAGLDVVPAVPGTFVGGHDVQGTDGTTRTDRPGELLGTPVKKDREDSTSVSQSDYVTQEVDRANREELPRLGGKLDNDWTPGDAKSSKAATAKAAADAKADAARTTETIAPVRTAAPARTTETASAPKSGIEVKSGISRG